MSNHNINKEELWSRISDDARMPKAPKQRKPNWWWLATLPLLILLCFCLCEINKKKDQKAKTIANTNRPLTAAQSGASEYHTKESTQKEEKLDKATKHENDKIYAHSSVISESTESINTTNIISKKDKPYKSPQEFTSQRIEKTITSNEYPLVTQKPTNQSKLRIKEVQESEKVIASEKTSSNTLASSNAKNPFDRNLNPEQNVGLDNIQKNHKTTTLTRSAYALANINSLLLDTPISSIQDLYGTVKDSIPLLDIIDDSHNNKTWEIYWLAGAGIANTMSEAIDSASLIFVDSLNMKYSSYAMDLGLKKHFGNWSIAAGLGVAIYQYSSKNTISDIRYEWDEDNQMTKFENIDTYTLYQKYSSLYTNIQAAYHWRLGSFEISPFAGANIKLKEFGYGSLIDENQNIIKINTANTKLTNRLTYSLGIGIHKSFNDHWTAQLRWRMDGGSTYDYNNQYKVTAKPMYISLGMGYRF